MLGSVVTLMTQSNCFQEFVIKINKTENNTTAQRPAQWMASIMHHTAKKPPGPVSQSHPSTHVFPDICFVPHYPKSAAKLSKAPLIHDPVT